MAKASLKSQSWEILIEKKYRYDREQRLSQALTIALPEKEDDLRRDNWEESDEHTDRALRQGIERAAG